MSVQILLNVSVLHKVSYLQDYSLSKSACVLAVNNKSFFLSCGKPSGVTRYFL